MAELAKSVAVFFAFDSIFFGGQFCQQEIKQKCIFGPRFVPGFLGYFYYKYRPCIRVNLEIEGAENKGLEVNKKN